VSPSFKWDPAKGAQNQRKHGVAFVDAQLAFPDPARVLGFIASEKLVEACSPYGLHTVAM